MNSNEALPPYKTDEIGTPLDYTEDVYKVYFEVADKDSTYTLLIDFLGEGKKHGIVRLTHGYELEIPIQCIPDITRLLCENNIGIYQIIRYAKTDKKWR